MPGVSFDRAVEYYDATRGYLPGVDDSIRDAILNFTQATPNSRFLELGVGTGRIALPFIKAGYNYTGVDISPAMMEKLKQKIEALAPNDLKSPLRYALFEADVTQRLPFADNEFNVIIIVHVLHLVDSWQAVLQEAKRVLRKPDGWLLIARDEAVKNETQSTKTESSAPTGAASSDPMELIHGQWDDILRSLGIEPKLLRPGIWLEEDAIEVFLKGQGANTEQLDLIEYERPNMSLRIIGDRHKSRMLSIDWALSDEAHAAASEKLEAWLTTQGDAADKPIQTHGRFSTLAVRWLE